MTGQVRTWVVKTGWDRPDQIKTGQDRLEHVKNPQNIWNKTSFWNFVRLCSNLFVFISIFWVCSTYAAMHKFCACCHTNTNTCISIGIGMDVFELVKIISQQLISARTNQFWMFHLFQSILNENHLKLAPMQWRTVHPVRYRVKVNLFSLQFFRILET